MRRQQFEELKKDLDVQEVRVTDKVMVNVLSSGKKEDIAYDEIEHHAQG